MKKLLVCAAILLIPCLITPKLLGQANVNESLETAFLYTDAVNGSDTNPCTQALPCQTIAHVAALAVANNIAGVGTRVTINAGTYRESVAITANAQTTSLPITFEAATNGTVFISGADVWTGWTPYSQNNNIYTDPWPYQYGLCDIDTSGYVQPDITRRREQVFVNGFHLTQVLALNDMLVGSFFVDETGGTIYIWPPTGTNINTATIEVATRDVLFSTTGLGNLVLRGLTFQYANGCRVSSTDGAALELFAEPSNILLDSDNFYWNNAQAVNTGATSMLTVQNAIANHNGQAGIGSYQAKNVLVQNSQASFNNWRGAQGAYYSWGVAGFHFQLLHDSTFTNLTAIYNQGRGLHFDTDNENDTVTGLILSQNLRAGAMAEKDQGPLTISNSYFCNNNTVQLSEDGGFDSRNSTFLNLNNDVFYNNGLTQLSITGQAGGILITDWETGIQYNLITSNLTSTQNILEGFGATQTLFGDGLLGGTDWTPLLTTLVSGNNTWWNASNTEDWLVPVPTENTLLDFAGWQLLTLQDLTSTFSAPTTDPSGPCQVTPDATDYWLMATNGVQTVIHGETVPYTITLVPLNYSGTITLTADGIGTIPGATGTFSTTSLTTSGGAQVSATYTITTSNTTPQGTYYVNVFATDGNLTRTVTLSLVIDTSVKVSPLSINFGNQPIMMTSASKAVTFTNNSTSAITFNTPFFQGTNAGAFAQTNTCGSSVAPGASCTINVTFTPEVVGAMTATLDLSDSAPSSPQIVSLSGTGTAPGFGYSPTTGLTFSGQVKVKTAPQTLTVTNTGTATLSISKVAVVGGDQLDYAISSDPCQGANVAPGASCNVSVTFTPGASGARNSDLVFTDNASGSPQQVPLTGTGLQGTGSASPSSLNFGNVTVHMKSAPQTVTLTNIGTFAMTITSVSITGGSALDYSQTNNCPVPPSTLAINTSCAITVTFTPGASGTRSSTLVIKSNASNSPENISLTGVGVTGGSTVTFNPTSLAFAPQAVGTTSAPMSVTLTNGGTSALTITKFTTTGTNLKDFTIVSNLCPLSPNTLAAGASCTFGVTFTPAAFGARSGNVAVTDNASGSPQMLPLTGTGLGASVTLSPTSLTFANQNVGTSSTPQNVTLTNAGNATLSITSITVSGVNQADFSQTNTCGTSVAAGGSCTISVTFTPTASGTRSANVLVTDNAPMSPQKVALSGTGVGPAVTFSPTSLTFPATAVGTSSSPMNVTLTNTGNATLSITSITIVGANFKDFSQTNTCGTSVAAGGSCTITVTFMPTAVGTRSATVSVTDNAPKSPQRVTLTGTGI